MVYKCKTFIVGSCTKAGKCKIMYSKHSQKGSGILKIISDLISFIKIN